MSFGFRERVNRDKPRLSERFRGKSGEEIAEELRKDFAKRKQMFFDTAPHTPDFGKPGFPFDSSSRWRNRGDSDLRHRLDEIADRYPQFADQLRDWTSEEESPSGMGWGSKQAQPQPATPQQTGQASQPEAATTTQQPQQPPPTQPAGPEGDARTQRAMSAPPDNRAKDQGKPQRFVSRLEINPNSAPEEVAQQPQQPVKQQPQPEPQPSQPQPQQSAQPEPKKKPSNVRHIPIFVEGRNETVMPRADVDSSTADFGRSFGSPPRERDSRDREDGFHGPAYAKYAPSGFGFMNKPWHSSFNQRTSPFMTRDPVHGSPPQHQQHFPHQTHYQPHHPQQQHDSQHSHPQAQPHPHGPEKSAKVPRTPVTTDPQHQQQHPQQQHPQQPPPHSQPPQPQQTFPRQPPPKPKDALEVVADVQKDVDELMKQVEAFKGSRQDKQYIYLDEMLTRNLLKLDLVETEGRENVRAARKDTIRCIQKGISILESKAMTPEGTVEENKAMDVDPETAEAQPMEVTPGGEGDPAATPTPPADSAAPSPAPVPSATPAAETPTEPTTTSAPAPAPEPSPTPMDATSAPAEPGPESTPMEPNESNTASTVNPEASAPPETTATSPVNNAPSETAAPAAAAS